MDRKVPVRRRHRVMPTMELYDIGPNAHSEELTIVHLPCQRVPWQPQMSIFRR